MANRNSKKILSSVVKSLAAGMLLLMPLLPAQLQKPSRPGPTEPAIGVKNPNPLAEEIVRTLKDNPALLADAKSTIAAELTRRNYPVREEDLADEKIFSQIRSNSQFRKAVAESLQARGYLMDFDEAGNRIGDEGVEETKPVANADSERGSANAPNSTNTNNRKRVTPPAAEKVVGPKLTTRPNPYRDVPSLAGLYRQYTDTTTVLERFGSGFFRDDLANSEVSSMEMPLGAEYVVGPGDVLEMNIYGGYSAKLVRAIDHEGRIALPEAGTVLIGGMTLDNAQESIRRALGRQFKDIGVDLSISRLRRVRIYVVGDVKRPGGYDVSALSSPLTALLAAGGPSESGSFRIVSHFRGKKRLRDIDLYEWMLRGVQSSEDQLQSGDSILVPPAGPQVGIAGMVRRPAIYELSKEETMADVLELAGGILVTGALSDIKIERIEAHQYRVMMSLRLDPKDKAAAQVSLTKFAVRDGDRITISPILPYSDKVVFLQGHVFRPGSFPYWDGMTVKDLVQGYQNMLPEPADRVEVVRLKPPDYRPSVIGITLADILGPDAKLIHLLPFDTVRLFGRYETDAPTVSVYGQVLRPGEYPLSDGMTASDLVKLAGGFKRSAFTKSADLSSYDSRNGESVVLDHREVQIQKAMAGEADTDVRLKPGDVLTIRQLAQWSEIGGSINIAGAVLYPGRYGIQQGEKLSSVLRRAGGFSLDSYPMGAVLERTQVKEIASRSRDQLVQRLESQAFDKNNPIDAQVQAGQQRQRLIERLKQATPSGRLVIRIAADIGAWENTSSDIEVRPGDSLFIPKQPNFVLVDGQVYSPSAITFLPGKTAGWYLKQAGGPTEFANRKDVFVVRANGSVIGRDSGSWWTGGILNTRMDPGDTLVVPEKVVSGTTFWRELAQSAQVVSAIAIAARVAASF